MLFLRIVKRNIGNSNKEKKEIIYNVDFLKTYIIIELIPLLKSN